MGDLLMLFCLLFDCGIRPLKYKQRARFATQTCLTANPTMRAHPYTACFWKLTEPADPEDVAVAVLLPMIEDVVDCVLSVTSVVALVGKLV